jgi:hypothetical protein
MKWGCPPAASLAAAAFPRGAGTACGAGTLRSRATGVGCRRGVQMTSVGPGFAVLYRWRLREGAETSFIEGWSRISQLLLRDAGSLGSRLHRGPDGLWYSYAQWPSAQAREQAFARGSLDPQASRQMREAIAETLPEIVLESVADFMVLPPQDGT